ncbi:hypothetical protein TeGR_g9159 [Tetraparma gracilis]|uniref:Lipase maturation factor 1/2 C-terminal domain-containing protein n=1 Tax=Tetraparma gracilis TaxID=2962635 RepID=A0ABQ6ML26_9STRA|nr:hypothetical protein TeGR_g9159 [Tetraparma gracilis]
MLSKDQVMNASFDRFRLVSSCGAFGTVAAERTELVVLGADATEGPWKEYRFKVKAGDVNKKPRFINRVFGFKLKFKGVVASLKIDY